MGPVLIEHPRFLLRDFEAEDRDAFVDYQLDPRYLALYDLDPRDTRRAHDLFDLFREWQRARPRTHFQLGIFERSTGRLCGCAGVRGTEGDESTIGIELAPRYWGRFALALDATAALLAFGFERLHLRRVVGSTASGNGRVEKLARWFGGRRVAEREGDDWMRARGWREVDWAVSREDWQRYLSKRAGRRKRLPLRSAGTDPVV